MLAHFTGDHEELVRRITLIGDKDPKVYEIESLFELFKFGFECSDIAPSMFVMANAFKDARDRAKGVVSTCPTKCA